MFTLRFRPLKPLSIFFEDGWRGNGDELLGDSLRGGGEEQIDEFGYYYAPSVLISTHSFYMIRTAIELGFKMD